MRWFLWLAAALIAAVGAFGVWHAVNNPAFWLGLGAAVWAILGPILLKRKSPEDEAKDRQRVREGDRDKRSDK